ncbi:hypothetical protein ACFL3F_02895 [Planctomycetota bacterium]
MYTQTLGAILSPKHIDTENVNNPPDGRDMQILAARRCHAHPLPHTQLSKQADIFK